MMAERWRPERVFVYRHPVDMRKQIDGLAALVATELGQDPADRSMYVFTIQWPDWFEGDSVTLTHEQLEYLLDGYNLNGMRPHRKLFFAHSI